MRSFCTICARGGSKGLVGKNVRELLGKPLLAWTIDQARQTGLFEVIAFSSDFDLLLQAALKAGADIAVKRPDVMATDTAPKLPAIRHCLEEAIAHTGNAPDIFVDLDVTSPLRLPSDITGAVEMLQKTGAHNVITGGIAPLALFQSGRGERRWHGRFVQGHKPAGLSPAGCAALLRHERLDLCMARRRVSRKPVGVLPGH